MLKLKISIHCLQMFLSNYGVPDPVVGPGDKLVMIDR